MTRRVVFVPCEKTFSVNLLPWCVPGAEQQADAHTRGCWHAGGDTGLLWWVFEQRGSESGGQCSAAGSSAQWHQLRDPPGLLLHLFAAGQVSVVCGGGGGGGGGSVCMVCVGRGVADTCGCMWMHACVFVCACVCLPMCVFESVCVFAYIQCVCVCIHVCTSVCVVSVVCVCLMYGVVVVWGGGG